MRDLNPRSPAYKTGALTNYANRTGFFSWKPFLITFNINIKSYRLYQIWESNPSKGSLRPSTKPLVTIRLDICYFLKKHILFFKIAVRKY